MTGVEVALGLLGGVVSAAGSIAQGQAAAQAADYNRTLYQQQAQAARDTANSQAMDYRRQEHMKLAASQAARGATGVVTTAGSPLMVDEATVRESALGAARLSYKGTLEANRFNNEADLAKMQGQNALTAGYLGAGTSLLSGFGSAMRGFSGSSGYGGYGGYGGGAMFGPL